MLLLASCGSPGKVGEVSFVEEDTSYVMEEASYEYEEMEMLEGSDVVEEEVTYHAKKVTINANGEICIDCDIVDLTDDEKITDDNFGTIAYNVPDSFKVDKYSTIKLRISKEKTVESVVIGDRDIPLVADDSHDRIIVESILIDDKMSATLYADSDIFEIKLTSQKEQNIFENGYTEWVWRVRPLKSGLF